MIVNCVWITKEPHKQTYFFVVNHLNQEIQRESMPKNKGTVYILLFRPKSIRPHLKLNTFELKSEKWNTQVFIISKCFWSIWILKIQTVEFFVCNLSSRNQRTRYRWLYRHGMCFRVSFVFVLSILFWFPQRTHYFWRILRFLFMECKQDYNVTSVKNVKVCF